MLTGFVEAAHINPFHFEREIRTFDTHGYARDPSAETSQLYVGDVKKAEANLGVGVFDSKKTGGEKRRRACNFDSSDVDGYTGPWGGYEVEERVSKPDADTQMVMDEFMRKKRKHSKANKKAVAEAANIIEETTTLHCKWQYSDTVKVVKPDAVFIISGEASIRKLTEYQINCVVGLFVF
jgi:pre-mRNA-processing factor 17